MSLGEIAGMIPAVTRIFESYGIDYCCGGGKSLEEACAKSKIPTQDVLQSIQLAQQEGPTDQQNRDWLHQPLVTLITHIESAHHKYTRGEVIRLVPMLRKLITVHGKNHPELERICAAFESLAVELTDHMEKEETVLFPYIVRMAQTSAAAKPHEAPGLGTIRKHVATMTFEHEAAGNKLEAIRQASSGYSVPQDGCTTYRMVYRALAAFEADLHQHIHLENNILFPRAIEVEEKLRSEDRIRERRPAN
jgi:regulator of cell morphogenesis and NO signaling